MNLLLLSSIKKFKEKERTVQRSGRTGPAYSAEENLCSEILALDDSIRINNQNPRSAQVSRDQQTNQTASNHSTSVRYSNQILQFQSLSPIYFKISRSDRKKDA